MTRWANTVLRLFAHKGSHLLVSAEAFKTSFWTSLSSNSKRQVRWWRWTEMSWLFSAAAGLQAYCVRFKYRRWVSNQWSERFWCRLECRNAKICEAEAWRRPNWWQFFSIIWFWGNTRCPLDWYWLSRGWASRSQGWFLPLLAHKNTFCSQMSYCTARTILLA